MEEAIKFDVFKTKFRNTFLFVHYFLELIAKKKSTIGKHYKIFPTFCLYVVLEPVCCKKQQKKVPDQLLVCGIEDL